MTRSGISYCSAQTHVTAPGTLVRLDFIAEGDMSYSTLMVHLELGSSNAGLLRVALGMAERFGSNVIGIAGCPPLQMDYAEGFSVDIFEQEQLRIEADLAAAEAEFHAAMTSKPGRHGWRSTGGHGSVARFIAQEARAADLVLTGVSQGEVFAASRARAVRTSDLVLQVGRPVLLVPPVAQCPSEDGTVDEYDPYDTPMALGAVLARAGIPFALASQDWETAMNLPLRAGRLCAFGLSHDASMRALTLDAAQILGLGATLGSLQAGKTANVVVTDGDPLEATTSLRYLFMDGKPVPLQSHYTDLYRRYMGRVR